jgi:hypothetical protein
MKRLILGLVLAGLIALAVPSSAPAATYDLFAGCDATATSPQRSHDCLTTDHMAAYFEASEDTKYEVCLYQNVTELLDCTSEEEAEADTLYQNELTIETPGHYEVVWFDTTIEVELGDWDLNVANPPPPPPPPAPPAPAPIVLPAQDAEGQGQESARPQEGQAQGEAEESARRREGSLLSPAQPPTVT